MVSSFRGGGNDLAGNVAVLDGKLYPLRDFTVEREVDTETTFDATYTKQGTVVTGETISGRFETYRAVQADLHPTTKRMYFFPQDGGTEERLSLEDVMISGTALDTKKRTQSVDFVASELRRS